MRAADKRLATAADYADPVGELDVPSLDLETIVSRLRQSREVTHRIRYKGTIRRLPSRDALIGILDDLSAALFPAHYGQSH
jgi:serine O-acetyltransferase